MCFIRINPATAPLTPPGAAPTLTTIDNETDSMLPSESACTRDSLPKETHVPSAKQSSRRKHRLGMSAKLASAGTTVEGKGNEKKRVQEIADSLDLGGDLGANLESPVLNGPGIEAERRRGTVSGIEEPNRVVREGDSRLGIKEGRRASIPCPGSFAHSSQLGLGRNP